jgi:hypothetical protein
LTELALHRSLYSDDWMNLLELFDLKDVADAAITPLSSQAETRP